MIGQGPPISRKPQRRRAFRRKVRRGAHVDPAVFNGGYLGPRGFIAVLMTLVLCVSVDVCAASKINPLTLRPITMIRCAPDGIPRKPSSRRTRSRTGSFGQLKAAILDEQVDAQPLVVSGLTIAGQTHDVVFVVTENNTVYAIDALTGSILQQRNLGPPVSAGAGGAIDCGNNSSKIGVTSTPVIDRGADALYLIAFTLDNNQPVYRLHALDLVTLADKVAPQVVSASVALADGSTYAFNAKVSRQRAALALSNDNKVIYGAFASFCDHDSNLTRGWIIGWDAQTLTPIAPAVTDHRAGTATHYYLTSIWMSGYGPSVDSDGNVYFITGNSRRGHAWRAAGH